MEHRTCLRKTVNVCKVLVGIFEMEETNWEIVYAAVAPSCAIHGGKM